MQRSSKAKGARGEDIATEDKRFSMEKAMNLADISGIGLGTVRKSNHNGIPPDPNIVVSLTNVAEDTGVPFPL